MRFGLWVANALAETVTSGVECALMAASRGPLTLQGATVVERAHWPWGLAEDALLVADRTFPGGGFELVTPTWRLAGSTHASCPYSCGCTYNSYV